MFVYIPGIRGKLRFSVYYVKPLQQVIKLYPGIPKTIICRAVPVKTVVLLFYTTDVQLTNPGEKSHSFTVDWT